MPLVGKSMTFLARGSTTAKSNKLCQRGSARRRLRSTSLAREPSSSATTPTDRPVLSSEVRGLRLPELIGRQQALRPGTRVPAVDQERRPALPCKAPWRSGPALQGLRPASGQEPGSDPDPSSAPGPRRARPAGPSAPLPGIRVRPASLLRPGTAPGPPCRALGAPARNLGPTRFPAPPGTAPGPPCRVLGAPARNPGPTRIPCPGPGPRRARPAGPSALLPGTRVRPRFPAPARDRAGSIGPCSRYARAEPAGVAPPARHAGARLPSKLTPSGEGRGLHRSPENGTDPA